MSIFHCETNYAISGAVGGITALIAIACVLASIYVAKKNQTLLLILTAISAVSTIVSTLFCYNQIVLIGYILSIVATGILLTKVCRTYHQNTIYDVSSLNLFGKIIIPLSVIFEFFRPMFVVCKNSDDEFYYRFWSALGMNCYSESMGKYAMTVSAQGYSVYNIEAWNIMSIICVIISIAVLVMQGLLIWRQFKDPDNARDWADIGLVITCIGTVFVYGIFTSNNFGIINVENTTCVTFVVFMIIILGALNRVLYLPKVEAFIDKYSAKFFKNN